MTAHLPARATLEQLKKQAKDLLKAHARRETSCLPLLSRLSRFRQASPDDILAADVSLQECQHALALEYGFASWQALSAHLRGAAAHSPTALTLDEAREQYLANIETAGRNYLRRIWSAQDDFLHALTALLDDAKGRDAAIAEIQQAIEHLKQETIRTTVMSKPFIDEVRGTAISHGCMPSCLKSPPGTTPSGNAGTWAVRWRRSIPRS
jgi:hypothetical protein